MDKRALLMEQVETNRKNELSQLLHKSIEVLGIDDPITILISQRKDVEIYQLQKKWRNLQIQEEMRKSYRKYKGI